MLPIHPPFDDIVGRIIHGIVADIVFGSGLLAAPHKVPHCFVTISLAAAALFATTTPVFVSVSTTANKHLFLT